MPSRHVDSAAKTIPSAARWQDCIAGLSVAGLLLPEAVAYSSIANLPLQTGIIALFAGLVCYALLGSSRFAIVSATSSSAAVLAASTLSLAGADAGLRLVLAAGLTIVTGAFFILASLARLGNATDFIAKPVLRGFAFGLSVIIVLKQFVGMVGIASSHGDIVGLMSDLTAQAGHWNHAALAVGVAALALLMLFARSRVLPGGLMVIALGIAANHWLGLAGYGVGMVGSLQPRFDMPALPLLSKADWMRLAELGCAMVLILYSESYGSIRTYAIKHGDSVSPNRDLLALGVANLVSGLLRGMPVGAGYSATSVCEAAGARTRLSGGVAALVVLILVLTVLPYIAQTPLPVLAAIVMHAVSHSLNPAIFRPYFAWHRDRLVLFAAILGVLLLGVLHGLLFAIGISLMLMLRRFSESDIAQLGRLGDSHNFVDIKIHPEAQAIPGIIIVRPDEPLFFANTERILGQVRQAVADSTVKVHTIIISLEETPDLDSTSLEALRDFFAWAFHADCKLLLARLKHPVHQILQQVVDRGLSAPLLSGLSVDDAVRIALGGDAVPQQ